MFSLSEKGWEQTFQSLVLNMPKQALRRRALFLADTHQIPFVGEAFDSVSCLGSFEHYLKPDQAFAEISRILTPDGLLLISVPNKRGWTRCLAIFLLHFRRQPVQRHFSVKEFSDLLTQNGFHVTRVINPNQIIPFGKLDSLNKIFQLVDHRVSAPIAVEPLYICSKTLERTHQDG